MRGRPRTAINTPYRLHEILRAHGIPHTDLRSALTFQSGVNVGRPIAPSTLSALLVRRVWPTTIRAESIQAQVAQFLRDRAVPEAEIAQAWSVPDGVVDAGAPVGRPLLAVGRHAGAQPIPSEEPFVLPETEMLSPATKQHFNLAMHPFVDDVQGPQDVFLSKDQRYIRESMYYAAKHGGLLAVIGESGSGKSTLRRDLVERIRRDAESLTLIQPQTIDKSALTAAHICDAIIADLSMETPKLSLEAKARQVQRILIASARAGNVHALLIEEAHDLKVPTLKYVKRFWELEDGFRRLIGVVMIGQPELGKKLDEQLNPDLRELIRRCEVAHLKPLNGNLEEYLALKFKRVGAALEAIFETDAYDAIRQRLTRRRGTTNEVENNLYPLVVQNLCIKAMNQAAELGLPKISAQLVGRL